MDAEQTKVILHDWRDDVINFYYENVRQNYKHYDLRWFMTQTYEIAKASWTHRKNISKKDLNSVLKSMMKSYRFLEKGYVSNWQKAVNYYGYDRALQILNAK